MAPSVLFRERVRIERSDVATGSLTGPACVFVAEEPAICPRVREQAQSTKQERAERNFTNASSRASSRQILLDGHRDHSRTKVNEKAKPMHRGCEYALSEAVQISFSLNL